MRCVLLYEIISIVGAGRRLRQLRFLPDLCLKRYCTQDTIRQIQIYLCISTNHTVDPVVPVVFHPTKGGATRRTSSFYGGKLDRGRKSRWHRPLKRTWCFLGLPSLLLSTERQQRLVSALFKNPVSWLLPWLLFPS